MRGYRIIRGCLVAGVIAASGCASTTGDRPAEPQSAPPPPAEITPTAKPATPPQRQSPRYQTASIDAAVVDVQTAWDMESATEAYDKGLAIDAGSVALHRAYMLRAVQLGEPDVGIAAAKKVLAADPADGVAHGVIAFTDARRGRMPSALTEITLAARRAEDDPFVQDTAGHLLAWYDHTPDRPALPTNVKDGLRYVHMVFDGRQAFADAYQDATLFYLDQRRRMAAAGEGGAATQPSGNPSFEAYGGTSIPGGSGATAAVDDDGAEAAPPQVVFVPYPVPVYEETYIYAPFDYGGFGYAPGILFAGNGYYSGHRHRLPHRGEVDQRFCDRFFGQHPPAFANVYGGRGSRNVGGAADVTGAHGFPMLTGANATVRATRGEAMANRATVASSRSRGANVLSGNSNLPLPFEVRAGAPGYTHFVPSGVPAAGGAVNVPVPAAGMPGPSAIGMPPGFIATTPSPSNPPSAGAPTPAPARGGSGSSGVASRGGGGGNAGGPGNNRR